MATSSFDSTIKINKKSANSLIKILEEEIYEHVDLNTSIEVKKVNKGKVIPKWVNKPLKVSDLLKICKNAVDDGLGDKYVFISQDEEGNGFHALLYSFTTQIKDYADLIYQVNEEDLEDIIILG